MSSTGPTEVSLKEETLLEMKPLVIDENEIMARNNGSAAPLFLNHNGGNVLINGTNVDGTNVGIGTTTPGSDLHIVHENGFISNGLTLTDNFSSGLNWNIYSAVSGGDIWISHNGVLRGTFDGDNGVYTPMSDRKFKRDIVGMDKLLEKVMKLKPSFYQFNNQTSNRRFIGMIAQDVLPLFPEAVYQHSGSNDGTDDFLTLDYSAFGVIAIKAIQELAPVIEEQKAKIATLEERIAKLERALNSVSSNNVSGKQITGASLQQNHPNPFNQITTIRYSIPDGVSAQIVVYDAAGRLVKTLQATQSGQSQIYASELKPGTYKYALVANGNIIASKTMVLLK